MSSRCLDLLAGALLFVCLCATSSAATERVLRVCADPDNLPYSDRNGGGFENRIAELVARELQWKLQYTWAPHLRGFVRKTLGAHVCDVLIGVPAELERVRTTVPYYRSSYVFVQREAAGRAFERFDDPRLANARIGVQLIGDDLAATPPAHALAARGITRRVFGYPVLGERPQAERMIADVAHAVLDVALVWGPQGAFYAKRQRVPLSVSIAQAPPDMGAVPFEFSIAMGVRREDAGLASALDDVIDRRRAELRLILDAYGVPQVREAASRRTADAR
jgi:mxaJ protein